MLLASPKGGFEIIASPIPFSLSYKALVCLPTAWFIVTRYFVVCVILGLSCRTSSSIFSPMIFTEWHWNPVLEKCKLSEYSLWVEWRGAYHFCYSDVSLYAVKAWTRAERQSFDRSSESAIRSLRHFSRSRTQPYLLWIRLEHMFEPVRSGKVYTCPLCASADKH